MMQTDLAVAVEDEDDDELDEYQVLDERVTIDEAEKGSLTTSLVYSNALRGLFSRVVVDEGHNIKVRSLTVVVKRPFSC